MEVATLREVINLTNNTKGVTPYTLREVLKSYATIDKVKDILEDIEIDPSHIDLSSYAKKSDIPTKLSQLTNDADYIKAINGLIPSSYLPSYVDDVLEYPLKSSFPMPGDSGKIYVDTSTNITYRWGGTDYVEISRSLAIGTTADSAFRGDYGQIAYEHAISKGNPHNLTLTDLGITISADTLNFLQGLDENILTTLAKKLNLSGGIMTGFITLHANPTDKYHAATKKYVDDMIDGISVSVTQNITRITEISGDLDHQKSLLGVQAETIVEVQNDITGLNQKTTDNTTAISKVEQDVSSITTTISETKETVTVLEATVNQLAVELTNEIIIVPVKAAEDEKEYPLLTATYNIKYTAKFRGNEIDPENITFTGIGEGIEVDYDSEYIIVRVDNTKDIPDSTSEFVVTFDYTSGVKYTVNKMITVATVVQGKDGLPGTPGAPGKDGTTYYTWIMYSKGTADTMQNSSEGMTHIGIAYNKETMEESNNYDDYQWSLIKGKDGKALVEIIKLYAVSEDKENPPSSGWIPVMPDRGQNQVIWAVEQIVYTEGDPVTGTPYVITGDKGSEGKSAYEIWLEEGNTGTEAAFIASLQGQDGVGIYSVSITYQQGDSPINEPTGEWDDSPPEIEQGKYLWTKTVTKYTDNIPDKTTYSVAYNGVNGKKGDTTYTWIKYSNGDQASMSDLPEGKTHIGIAYNKTSSTESPYYNDYNWSLIKGEDGTTILNSYVKYCEHTSATDIPDESKFIHNEPPEVAQGNYLWTKTYTLYSNGTETNAYSVTRIPIDGTDGEDAAIIGPNPPEDTNMLWLDTNTGLLKRYTYLDANETEAAWVVVNETSDYSQELFQKYNDLKKIVDDEALKLSTITSRVEKTMTKEETKDSIQWSFDSLDKTITDIEGKLTEYIQEQSKYIRFEDGTIILGEKQNAFKLKIFNDQILIYYNDREISEWRKDTFRATYIEMKDNNWNYKFVWMPRSNGSYSLRRVSD